MIQVAVKPLRAALKAMTKVVEKRSTVPILSSVLITAGPSTMTLTTTDMDLQMVQQMDHAIPGKGQACSFCVDAGTLSGIAGKLPEDAIATIKLADGKAIISAGRSRFTLPVLAAEDFPLMAPGSMVGGGWDVQFEIPSTELVAAIDAVRAAISTEDVRYYLNGIFLHLPGERMIAAATDGSRLARYDFEAPEDAAGMADIIVGRKMVGVLADLLDDHGGPVEIALSKGRILVELGTISITAKLIDGQFPDYTRVIPTSNERALWIDPKLLAEAVDRVLTIADGKTKVVSLALENDLCRLRVVSPEKGEAVEELECEYDADPLTIGFNGRYLLDMLGQLRGRKADDDAEAPALTQAMFGDAATPTLWRDAEDSQRLYVLMPFRV
ncbi:DNA polymerase III subunit beta [Sphingobium sp. H39-3-25]|uniref:DNA polymerase III subunit beta n=1 Tax=Sphingobium arseniciresistens TaxID=3030834 RepID=UPI0023BA0785|nr:DNA polymerase III subunit beta [Sphingobium arseniciresistens]